MSSQRIAHFHILYKVNVKTMRNALTDEVGELQHRINQPFIL
jgi:hypothetical protein